MTAREDGNIQLVPIHNGIRNTVRTTCRRSRRKKKQACMDPQVMPVVAANHPGGASLSSQSVDLTMLSILRGFWPIRRPSNWRSHAATHTHTRSLSTPPLNRPLRPPSVVPSQPFRASRAHLSQKPHPKDQVDQGGRVGGPAPSDWGPDVSFAAGLSASQDAILPVNPSAQLPTNRRD